MFFTKIANFYKICCLSVFICLNCCVTAYAAGAAAPSDFWIKLWGQPANEPTLALGMWSYHLKHESQDMDNSNNQLFGFVYKGLFAGTLVNSEDRRSYVFGVQRYWLTKQLKPDLTYQLGYRLGLIYGYDEKLGHFAGQSPVVPFPQLISDLTWNHFGWELSYTWVVVSTSFYIRF